MASPIASKIYQQLPKQKGLQQRMTGMVMKWLKEGISIVAAAKRLQALFLQPAAVTGQDTMYRHQPIQRVTVKIHL
ncbi:MAG: hypothetical protein EKK39_05025 [Sphingobacteriales bacterium]|uniref:hypothetical protein n=1 Tax=Hydrotalea flava TaxID=714549 RepID=UPI000836C7B8|nr:hypothetical protein [Hydrotalea flava]RTL53196.1 MAG: hypothetical protein EKK39_05025 [Sphingobacteriales bacterium]